MMSVCSVNTLVDRIIASQSEECGKEREPERGSPSCFRVRTTCPDTVRTSCPDTLSTQHVQPRCPHALSRHAQAHTRLHTGTHTRLHPHPHTYQLRVHARMHARTHAQLGRCTCFVHCQPTARAYTHATHKLGEGKGCDFRRKLQPFHSFSFATPLFSVAALLVGVWKR